VRSRCCERQTKRLRRASAGFIGSRSATISHRVADLIVRHEAILAQARIDAERWVDDGGSFRPEGVSSATTGDEPTDSSESIDDSLGRDLVA
jgi:hypothetical protein